MKCSATIAATAVWLTASLGIGVVGAIRHRYLTQHGPPHIYLMEKLRDLYTTGKFDEVLVECDRAEIDPRYVECTPQIMYMRWAANRQLQNTRESERLCTLFLARFPGHALAADMHLSLAADMLATGQYAAAEDTLAMIVRDYASAPAAKEAKRIRMRMIQKRPPR